jgi:hypothetical protein
MDNVLDSPSNVRPPEVVMFPRYQALVDEGLGRMRGNAIHVGPYVVCILSVIVVGLQSLDDFSGTSILWNTELHCSFNHSRLLLA